MSKENNNLRLLGSPVNLSYRSKKKDDKKSIRNRPRSALQNSCITPATDRPERYKRPFSADAKATSTRGLLKAFSADLIHSYNNSPAAAITVKVVPPTTEILGDRRSPVNSQKRELDISSNASDYGSEDTFISLGTKIKAKAQISPKPKNTNTKNFLKYRNIAKKSRKPMETPIPEDLNNEYNLEVKITERRSPSPQKNKNMFNERSFSPTLKTRPYESYFIPLENEKTETESSLAGRVSFGYNIQEEVEQAIDTYTHRLTVTKQQLSLVEEESTQDLDSVPSQNSISPDNCLEDPQNTNTGNIENNITSHHSYVLDTKEDFSKISHSFTCEPRTYTSFYDDFRSNSIDPYKAKMSSPVITDSSSKDSGYPDSGPNDEKSYKPNYSLPTTSSIKKSLSYTVVKDQPKSLDSSSTSTGHSYKTFPLDKKDQWEEPLNHSRLLYKDFFLKKEGHIAIPPNNSPTKVIESYSGTNQVLDISEEKQINTTDLEYPPYLTNSTTKAYTSKVLEDYKKELEAINSLHKLTLKDIKTDAISPTPLNIDKMFEDNLTNYENKESSSENSLERASSSEPINNQNSYEIKQRRDIAKISTKELIQNYLKVKEGDIKDFLPKNNTKKVNNVTSKYENVPSRYKQDWNNRSTKSIVKSNTQVDIRNPTQNNMYMRAPLSARIDGVTNDKDIDSWMSLSAPSPRVLEIGIDEESNQTDSPPINVADINISPIENQRPPSPPRPSIEKETVKPSELNSNSTVLDIYSMLKEIESYGDNPVTSAVNSTTKEPEDKDEDRNATPKDHFMEIFQFLEKVEQSANDALSIVTNSTPQSIPQLEMLLKLPQTELAQRLVTASLQLEERSCCIALLQESLTNHKEQMINKVSNLEKQSLRNVAKVKQECEDAIKRHQNFIDQLINDKKTLNHRIEQLVDERRSLEERWKRSAQALEERYKLELRNQHDKMAAAQQVARQRWVRQKAEKIKELTVKGLEGELREMAERQQKEISDLKMSHAEQMGRSQARHAQELEELRRTMEDEREAALVKERQLASTRLEKQILSLEVTYREQRTRLIAEMRAENERVAAALADSTTKQRDQIEKWREEEEQAMAEKRSQMEKEIAKKREEIEELLKQKQQALESQFEQFKKEFEAEQHLALKRKVTEIAAQHKQERDREIEKAIESMDAEAQAGRKELQEAIRRNKEQYEAELKELAETEQATLRRYQEAQARVRQTEDKCAELEVAVNQLETRNRVLTEKNIQLEGRVEEIQTSCDQAWTAKMETLHKDMESMRKTHEEQMHQLYAKVKVAVSRKDSAIQALTREAAKYQEKIAVLEQKLQQQRKDFLKHK